MIIIACVLLYCVILGIVVEFLMKRGWFDVDAYMVAGFWPLSIPIFIGKKLFNGAILLFTKKEKKNV